MEAFFQFYIYLERNFTARDDEIIRELFQLRYVHGWSDREVARQFGLRVNIPATYQTLYRRYEGKLIYGN